MESLQSQTSLGDTLFDKYCLESQFRSTLWPFQSTVQKSVQRFRKIPKLLVSSEGKGESNSFEEFYEHILAEFNLIIFNLL